MTIGERLLGLKERSGLSLAEIARRAGYRAPSSIQKLFQTAYSPDTLPSGPALRLVPALVGLGTPPITVEEIMSLAHPEGSKKSVRRILDDIIEDASSRILITQTAPFSVDARPELAFFRILDDVSEEIPTPESIRKFVVWGLYITRANMHPRYEVGELVLAQLRPPPRPGDDVIVFYDDGKDSKESLIVCRLVANDGNQATFEQFNPSGHFTLPSPSVRMNRVMRVSDLIR